MVVTLRDVAIAAGVSQATAARVLGQYGATSSKAEKRVMEAAIGLGYKTNRVAQALRLGQTRTVGFIPGDLENPFFAKIARQLGDILDLNGFTLVISSSDENSEKEAKIVETFQSHLFSGAVIAPASQNSAFHIEKLINSGLPLVLIDRGYGNLDVDTVLVNNEEAGYQAVRYLIELGHRRIAILRDSLQITSTLDRFHGYQRALAESGIISASELIGTATASRDDAYQAARTLLDTGNHPTAIFTTDNFMTEGALRALRDLGLRIPEDVSLLGFDDIDPRMLLKPAMTVVAQPIALIGQTAGELLLRRINGFMDAPQHINLSAVLIVRESTAKPNFREKIF